MRHPWLSVISVGEEVSSRNYSLLNNVLAGLEVPPEVGIVEWPRCKKKGEGKYVYLEDFYKGSVHDEGYAQRRRRTLRLSAERVRDKTPAVLHHTRYSAF